MQSARYPAKPRSHHPACQCPLCDRAKRATRKAAELRQLALRKVLPPATPLDRKEEKRRTALDAILADVGHTDRQTAALAVAETKARADLRGARFLELRQQGLSAERAFAAVDLEFGEGGSDGD